MMSIRHSMYTGLFFIGLYVISMLERNETLGRNDTSGRNETPDRNETSGRNETPDRNDTSGRNETPDSF